MEGRNRIWLRGDDPGKLVHTTNRLKALLASAFRLDEAVSGFKYDETPEGLGRDLSGYEDGTENPENEEAEEAAVLLGVGEGLDGSSFVATQKWVHELSIFNRMSGEERDNVFGRRVSDIGGASAIIRAASCASRRCFSPLNSLL